MQETKIVVVQSSSGRLEAELAKGALEDAGIHSMIQSDSVGECAETWHGPARGLKFWCARKTQLGRERCSLQRLRANATLARTSNLTQTLGHRGAALRRTYSD
jgi:hypothetical protein